MNKFQIGDLITLKEPFWPNDDAVYLVEEIYGNNYVITLQNRPGTYFKGSRSFYYIDDYYRLEPNYAIEKEVREWLND